MAVIREIGILYLIAPFTGSPNSPRWMLKFQTYNDILNRKWKEVKKTQNLPFKESPWLYI